MKVLVKDVNRSVLSEVGFINVEEKMGDCVNDSRTDLTILTTMFGEYSSIKIESKYVLDIYALRDTSNEAIVYALENTIDDIHMKIDQLMKNNCDGCIDIIDILNSIKSQSYCKRIGENDVSIDVEKDVVHHVIIEGGCNL